MHDIIAFNNNNEIINNKTPKTDRAMDHIFYLTATNVALPFWHHHLDPPSMMPLGERAELYDFS